MKIEILLLCFPFYLLGQNPIDCVDTSDLKGNYYHVDKHIIEGFSKGEMTFNMEQEMQGANDNDVIVLYSYVVDDKKKRPLAYLGFYKAISKEKGFKQGKVLAVTDENGRVVLSRKLKNVNYIAMVYPGFSVKILDYKKLVVCTERDHDSRNPQ